MIKMAFHITEETINQWFSARADFASLSTCDNVGAHFWLSQLEYKWNLREARDFAEIYSAQNKMVPCPTC
jgi:hypothetical protein